MSSPGAPASAPNRRQKRMGPAPFASFEDLSDELDSPEDKNTSGSVVRLPGIREDITPLSPAPHEIKTEFIYTGISLIGAPSTPTMAAPIKCTLETPAAPRIDISRASSSSHHDSKESSPERDLFAQDQSKGLGFREEGTLDLRSSTEELDFQEKKIQPQRPHSPVTLQEDSYHSHHRKDSQSSEIGLLCISGRTSRLSSIGSQGSAQSRVSNASHLSVISGQSGVSRSPSPHKMLLETSFCGTKPQKKEGQVKDHGTKDELEKVLLKRKHDPTKALLAEGIKVDEIKKDVEVKKEIEVKPRIQDVKSDITITVDKPYEKPKLPKRIVGESGTEYIYIPLKGPLPEDNSNGIPKTKVRETRSASIPDKIKEVPMKSSHSASPSPLVSRHFNDEPKYIRIKLKADHMYDDYGKVEFQKPDTLDFNNPKKPPQTFEQILSYQPTPTASPKHLTPSPSLSRKSSFASIFKSRESISPESPTTITRRKNTLSGLGEKLKERRRSRSKSRDRSSVGPSSTESIDSKGRQKSMFSIFKTKKTSQTSSPELPNLEGLVNVESKKLPKKKYYETPLEGDSIRIPLHSPTYYEQKHILQDFKTSSQDSQETVIEVPQKNNDKKQDCRQSSTSSENIVFTTRLGSANELFSTKLPKDKNAEVTTAIVETQKVQIKEEVESPYNEKVDERLQNSCHKLTNDVKIIDSLKDVKKVEEKIVSKKEDFKRKPPRDSKIEEKAVTKGADSVRIRLKDYSIDEPMEEIEVEKIENKISLKNEKSTPEETVVKVRKSRSSQRFEENIRKIEEKKIEEKASLFGDNEVDWTGIKEKVVFEDKKVDIEGLVSKKSENSVKQAVFKEEIKVEKEDINWFPNEFLDEKLEKFDTLIKAQKELNSIKKSLSRERFAKEPSEEMKPTQTAQEICHKEEVTEIITKEVIPDSKSVQDDHYSSESERDSEIDKKEIPLDQIEPERKGLVLQQDSFEDELPYIPTTLPQERSVAVPIIPIKQRSTFEMKTCPIERPRSTTPINPTCLEDYCEEVIGNINTETITKTIEKLRISLPRDDSVDRPKEKSPRKTNTANWFDFSKLKKTPDEAPPLPPKGVQKEWINFEEIPEKRKPPKRIQTIPSRGNIEVPESVLQENVIYTYVNPEDCKCECHERANQPPPEEVREDELPLLEDDNDEEKTAPTIDRIKLDVTIIDRRSIVSDSSVDLSTNVDQPDANGIDHSLQTPFTSDLGISSNRSSIISQDDAQSPDTDSPNAFPKT